VNNPPTSSSGSITGITNEYSAIDLQHFSNDVDGPYPLGYFIATLPTQGMLAQLVNQQYDNITTAPFRMDDSAAGLLYYLPNLDARGPNMDSFKFYVEDIPGDDSPTAAIIITVQTPLPPVNGSLNFEAPEDTPIYIHFNGTSRLVSAIIKSPPAKRTLYQWDAVNNKPGDLITLSNTKVLDPNGTVVFIPLQYEHSIGNNAYTSFLYLYSDGYTSTQTARVSFIVDSVLNAPSAISQVIQMDQDATLVVTVSATTVENTTLSYWVQTLPRNGELWAVNDTQIKQYVLTQAMLPFNVDNQMVMYIPPLKQYGPELGYFTFYAVNIWGNASALASIY